MAKKENKKNKNKNNPAATVDFPGIGTASTQAPSPSMPASTGMNITMPEGSMLPPTTGATLDRTQLTADQLHQLQMEEAIRESTDPSAKLKKLKSPLSVGSCLLNILVLVVLTFAIVFVWCAFTVDNFNMGVLFLDMMEKFGISDFFKKMIATIRGWFS